MYSLNLRNAFLFIIISAIISFCMISYAAMPDAANVKQVHEGATVGCTVCHPEGNFKDLNSYGNAYKAAGRNAAAVRAIDNTDSDGDTITNADEIKAGTNPGDALSN